MSSLRVIGGKVRGFRLKDVPGDSTRPITDRVKESLFNILGADIEHAVVWDLFGGTGCVGIEALSRGADYVVFTDKNRNAINTIKFNISQTGFTEESKVIFGDAFTLLRQHTDRTFDYIYIAPPQYKEMWKDAILILDDQIDHLAPDGWVIVQIHPREFQNLEMRNLEKFDERKYGNTLLVFYQRKLEYI
jgi:16S rRNA (guanine(966)-N(2))-methyltransferase RsmD